MLNWSFVHLNSDRGIWTYLSCKLQCFWQWWCSSFWACTPGALWGSEQRSPRYSAVWWGLGTHWWSDWYPAPPASHHSLCYWQHCSHQGWPELSLGLRSVLLAVCERFLYPAENKMKKINKLLSPTGTGLLSKLSKCQEGNGKINCCIARRV